MKIKGKWKFTVIILAVIGGGFFLWENKREVTPSVIYDKNGKEIATIKEVFHPKREEVFMNHIVVDSVLREVYEDMREEGKDTKNFGENLIKSGWEIHTTIDMNLQEKLNSYFKNGKNFIKGKEKEEIQIPQYSMVIMKNDGTICALMGGCNQDTAKNRVANELYPVGSTIKPVSIYAPALANNLINYSSLCNDNPQMIVIQGENVEWPQNADNQYEGEIPVAYALAKSKNTVAVNLGKQMGEEFIYNYLKNNYFSTLVDNSEESDKQLAALALGYFAKGVRLTDLTASYQPFSNGGKYTEPSIYTKVKNREGELIIKKNTKEKSIMSEQDAYIMNRLLINNVHGEDGIASEAEIEGMEVGGKTGTVTDGTADIRKLFIGMTPEYIAGIQVGEEEGIPLFSNIKSPGAVWKEVVENLPCEEKSFSCPKNIAEKNFCKKSGNLSGEFCQEIQKGYYKVGQIPPQCSSCNK